MYEIIAPQSRPTEQSYNSYIKVVAHASPDENHCFMDHNDKKVTELVHNKTKEIT